MWTLVFYLLPAVDLITLSLLTNIFIDNNFGMKLEKELEQLQFGDFLANLMKVGEGCEAAGYTQEL